MQTRKTRKMDTFYALLPTKKFKKLWRFHCVKSVCNRSFSGSLFPALGLNTERYSVSLRIQSECGKIRTRKTPNTDTLYVVFSVVVVNWQTFESDFNSASSFLVHEMVRTSSKDSRWKQDNHILGPRPYKKSPLLFFFRKLGITVCQDFLFSVITLALRYSKYHNLVFFFHKV